MLWWRWILGLLIIVLALVWVIFDREPPPRTFLDNFWEKHMVEGTFVIADFEAGHLTSAQVVPPLSIKPKEDQPIIGYLMSHPISIQQLGEGLFANGGWVLHGGLLRRIRDGLATYELYGKAVDRQFPHIPFPIHSDPPRERGYEFFLTYKRAGELKATIIRKWSFSVNEVAIEDYRIRGKLHYEPTTRIATATFTGFNKAIEERIDLSKLEN